MPTMSETAPKPVTDSVAKQLERSALIKKVKGGWIVQPNWPLQRDEVVCVSWAAVLDLLTETKGLSR